MRPILAQSRIEIEAILLDYPGIAIEIATLAARHNCHPVAEAHFHLAKLFDGTYWKALLSHTCRQNFRHLFELVADKHHQRVGLLNQLAVKDLTAEVFIERIMKQGEHLEQQLLATLEGIPIAVSRILDNLCDLEDELNS